MDGGDIDTTGAVDTDATDEAQTTPRDYEAEARALGWRPPEEFPGDPAKCVDPKTYVERGETMIPFLKKKTAIQDREIAELKRTVKQQTEFYSKAEQRAYERALADLQAKHDAAVETGDVAAARKVVADMDGLKAEAKAPEAKPDAPDPLEANRKFAEWVDENDWYVKDQQRRDYADVQAAAIGPAINFDGGHEAWLAEIKRRVERKFAVSKPSPVSGGGNRAPTGATGRTFADLPPQARAMADRFVKQGIIKDRAAYVKDYSWD